MNKKIEGTEMVDNPEHYNQGSLETIEVIEASLGGPTSDKAKGYLTGNVIKYLSRCDYKGKFLEDLKKAQWYLNRLVTNFEDNTPKPKEGVWTRAHAARPHDSPETAKNMKI